MQIYFQHAGGETANFFETYFPIIEHWLDACGKLALTTIGTERFSFVEVDLHGLLQNKYRSIPLTLTQR